MRRALEVDLVHEVSDEEDAAAARFEQVLGVQRIGQRFGIESRPLIADADEQARRRPARRGLEIDEDMLAGVVAVAVLDGVDHRFANRHADPVERVLVEAARAAQMIGDHLDEIQHLHRARKLEVHRLGPVGVPSGESIGSRLSQ